MKTIYVLIWCVFALITSTRAQVCAPPEPIDERAAVGIWQGHYTENGALKKLKIELREVGGQLVSYIDMPDRGIKNTRFETSICSSMELHMKKTSADNITLQFVGKPRDGKMSGRFNAGESCSSAVDSFSLIKTGIAVTLN
jgi:hypothetical protein